MSTHCFADAEMEWMIKVIAPEASSDIGPDYAIGTTENYCFAGSKAAASQDLNRMSAHCSADAQMHSMAKVILPETFLEIHIGLLGND